MPARIDGGKFAPIGATREARFHGRGRAWAHRLPLLALMFSGCTCGSNTPPAATPTRQAPTAARASDLPAGAAGAPAAPDPNDPARRATCESYVAVLSGEQADPALLASAEVQWLAQEAPNLTTCGAVRRDAPDACKPISQWRPCPTCEKVGTQGPKREVRTDDCYSMWVIFHEMKSHPKSRAFMLEECFTTDQAAAELCGGLINGLRSGDCTAAGKAEPLCSAMFNLDGARCTPVEGLADDLPTYCRKRIDSRGFLAKGLATLADSGAPTDAAVVEEFGSSDRLQRYAAAALGRAGACDAFAAEALQTCVRKQMPVAPPTSAATPAPTPVTSPAAAATAAPQVQAS